jgi:predicted kinase
MTTVFLMTGLPASGKTSFARTLDALRFSLDDYRAMMGIGRETWSDAKEAVAIEAMMASATAAVKSGYDIVIDNTHLVPRLPKMYRKAFSSLGVTFKIHDFTNVSEQECITRDAQRTSGHVGADIIRKLAARHADATKNGWRLTDKWMNTAQWISPKPYDSQPDLPSAILCDIDGTVAIHGDERGHYDYDKVSTDAPNESVIYLIEQFVGRHDVEVIFMSGREDRARQDTTEWLHENISLYNRTPQLFMRATGDHRPDYIVKSELFDEHIRNKYDVRFVCDDRDQVIKMWRELGLTALQVAPGDF